jgi:STE24 endopeptidase
MFVSPAPSLWLTLAFSAALCVSLLVRFWLATRQIRHVALNRQTVPPAFSAEISLAAHQKAADYTITKTRFGLLELALGSAVLLAWTLLGGLNALNQGLLEWLGGGMAQQLALLAGFALISGLIDLPLTLYQTFVIEHRFGFNKMTLRLWLADLLKSTLMGLVIGLPIAALILWLMGSAGRYWWLWAWGSWMGFNLLLLLIYPTFIAPLFNKFQPLDDESLKTRVTALMQRCGFAAKGLFVMDGSKRSAHANAYFTGFGASKRVVFYDTLLRQLEPGEVEAVLAHELGHFRHRHVLKRMASLFALSLVGFALLGWLSGQSWFYAGLGVTPNLGNKLGAPNDALALLLFVLAVPVFFLLCGSRSGPVLAQARIRGRRVRHRPDQRTQPGAGVAQVVQGQRLDPHPRSALREVLLLPSAGFRASGAHGGLMQATEHPDSGLF